MNKLIKSGLIFLIIYCPLAFGAVHIFSFTVMEIGVLLLWFGWLVSRILNSPSAIIKGSREKHYFLLVEWMPFHSLGLLFIGLILLQLIPWPSSWVKVISPETFRVYNLALETVPAFISLSFYRYATRMGLYRVMAYLGVFFLIINWADAQEKIQGLVYAFVFVGIFEAIYGILRFSGGYSHIWWFENIRSVSWVTGTYINKNHLAGLLEITIPITFGFLIATAGRRIRARERSRSQIKGIRGFLLSLDLGNSILSQTTLIIFLIAMMVLGLILSGSRGGIISLAVSFLFMNSILFFRKRFRRYATVSLIICSIALIYGLRTGVERTVQNFKNIAEDSEVRVRFAKTSLGLIKDFPLLGTGWGTFREAYRRYQDPEDETYDIDHAHHDWIELGAETGFLGLGLVTVSFLFCLGYFFSLWRKRKNSFSIGIGLGGMGAMVSLALHSFGDFNMHIPANALLLSMAMGIALASLIWQRESSLRSGGRIRKMPQKVTVSFPGWLRWPLALAVTGGFCCAVVVVVKPWLAERALPTLPDSTLEGMISPVLENACTAIHYERGNAEYFHWLAFLLGKKRDQETPDENSRKEEEGQVLNNLILLALRKAIQLNPVNPYYHLKLAEHMLKSGERFEDLHQLQPLMEASEKEYDRSLSLMPESANINFSAGCYWLWKSKIMEMEDEMACRKAFGRFIRCFRKAYHINRQYKQNIQQAVHQYYPDVAVHAEIFSDKTSAGHSRPVPLI
ncbi:MAG: O-antigen ligase family protein [bacterium]